MSHYLSDDDDIVPPWKMVMALGICGTGCLACTAVVSVIGLIVLPVGLLGYGGYHLISPTLEEVSYLVGTIGSKTYDLIPSFRNTRGPPVITHYPDESFPEPNPLLLVPTKVYYGYYDYLANKFRKRKRQTKEIV